MPDCGALIKAIDAYLEKANNDLAGQLGDEGFQNPRQTLHYLEAIEDEVTEALLEETDYFLNSLKSVGKHLRKAKTPDDEYIEHVEDSLDLEVYASYVWPEVKRNDRLKLRLISIFRKQFARFMPEFIGYYIRKTDRQLRLRQISRRTTAWVESWSGELADLMQLNSHTELERILRTGLEDGVGIAEFTRRILESGIRDERYKARRVAVTEVLRAHSVAQQEAFMQTPAVAEKMWRHTGNYRNDPRENHVAMSGQRVPVADPFELTGADGQLYVPMYPRDTILPAKESVNCHCICQPVVREDILGLSLEERQRLQRQAIDEMDDDWERELDEQNRAKAGIEETEVAKRAKKSFTFAANRRIIRNEWKEEDHPRDEHGLFSPKDGGSQEKIVESDLKRQKTSSIKRGIKSLGEKIKLHESYIANPKSHVADWDTYHERKKMGLINHWKKEIVNFQGSIERRITELKERGEYDE